MWIFLDFKSKASIENGFEKCTHGQRCLANNIVPSFGVGGGGGDLAFHWKPQIRKIRKARNFMLSSVHSNDDKCILFPFNADFQTFSYRILPETSRNVADERQENIMFSWWTTKISSRKLYSAWLWRRADATVKNTANHNRANSGVFFLNQSRKKVRICPFYMRSVKGMFQALFLSGYKRKGEGLIAG